MARATELANKLERMNRDRRDTEAAALKLIEARLETDVELCEDRLLVVDGDGWHRGVIGILASRVVDRTAKPSIVVSVEDGVAHGSGRSVDGFMLLNSIESCADLFTRFGGHAFAVGFAMPAERLPELKRRLREYANVHLAGHEPEKLVKIDAELPLDRITPVLAGWVRKLEPLGHANPEPVFAARKARLLTTPRIMKERHLRLELAQESANGETHASDVRPGTSGAVRAVGWGLSGLVSELKLAQGSLIDVAYRIRENEHPDFGGLEIEMVDVRNAGIRE